MGDQILGQTATRDVFGVWAGTLPGNVEAIAEIKLKSKIRDGP